VHSIGRVPTADLARGQVDREGPEPQHRRGAAAARPLETPQQRLDAGEQLARAVRLGQ
jgi:hypothetical protein